MNLSDDDVRAIATEARLSLTDEEPVGAARYINSFLGMLDRLKELDLKDVAPFSFSEAHDCPLRDDVPADFERIGEILNDRADFETSCFKVPRIMGGGADDAAF